MYKGKSEMMNDGVHKKKPFFTISKVVFTLVFSVLAGSITIYSFFFQDQTHRMSPTEVNSLIEKASTSDYPGAIDDMMELAVLDDVRAQTTLGNLLTEAQRYAEAKQWLFRAANAGHVTAQYNLANAYYFGRFDGKKDFESALTWYNKACINPVPDADACHNLATMYQEVTEHKSEANARLYYRRAANLGKVNSKFSLAISLLTEEPLDQIAALALLEEAASAGYFDAYFHIGIIYRDGEGVPKDMRKAASAFEKGALAGDNKSMFTLGFRFLYGDSPLGQDDEKAFEWFERAAESGYAEAYRQLGYMTLNGIGTKLDVSLSREFYEKSAASGDPDSLTNLAVFYCEGKGVTPDLDKCKSYLQKAVYAGDPRASMYMEMIFGENRDSGLQ